MELKRFFVQPQAIEGNQISLTGDEYVHMSAVLRFRIGYRCIVCDNSGFDYLCQVIAMDRKGAKLEVLQKQNNQSEVGYPLTVCCGVIKQEKMEYSIQKSVELGVHRIRPFVSEHTDEKRIRYDRANRIILESCKQCGRAKLPVIDEVCAFSQLFDFDGLTILAYENEDTLLLRDAIPRYYTKGIPIQILIGSEGGFTQEEVDYAKAHGAVVCSLGKRILRAETAAVVAIGTFTALTEEL